MLKPALAAVFGLTLLAGPAFAGTVATAKLSAPVEKTIKVVADKGVITCTGDTCTGVVESRITLRGCRTISEEVGQVVVSYSNSEKSLAAEDLAKCNAKVEAALSAKTKVAAQ